MFGVLVAAAAGAAWKFGWFPNPHSELDTEDGSRLGTASASSSESHVDPLAFPEHDGHEVDPFLWAGGTSTGAAAAGRQSDRAPSAADFLAGAAPADSAAHVASQNADNRLPPRAVDPRLIAPPPGAPAPPVRDAHVVPASAQQAESVVRGAPVGEVPASVRVEPAGTSSSQSLQPTSGELRRQLAEIDRLIQQGEVVHAHRELSTIYWNQPAAREEIRGRLEACARSIFFDPQPHYVEPHVVAAGDRLGSIARKYNVPWEYLAKLNRIDPGRIREGQRLKVNHGPFSAVVDLSDFELTVHAQGYFVHKFRIGIGKDNSTPLGAFRVQDKVVNPQYTDPDGRVWSADDPANPIGERWLALGGGYGIHGTIEPQSIGRAESRGCIRLVHDDIIELYDLLSVGSEVVVER